ncbi:MAG: ATP-grasp domain-containing protein [Patescibacteria group bacterium]|nr:ATP-grasp domain-containing protein [Patescibacteria group bacterium]
MKDSTASKPRAIWLITGGAMQRPAAERIKKRGYALIMSDGSAECALRSMADEFLHVDIFDIPKNIAAADELKNRYDIRAVFTAASDCHETVAHVARHLGLPGIDPEISRICRYKYETRALYSKAGIPQPKFMTAKTHEEALAALRGIGTPVALKATNNAGSRGFARIDTEKDLTPEAFAHAIKNGTTGVAIVEELLIPIEGEIAEQSVETLWYDGKMYWLSWTDRMFRNDMRFFPKFDAQVYENLPWAVEIGHLNPAVHSIETTAAVQRMAEQAGRALGMDRQKGGHIMKHDIMLTAKGPYILESTPRLSGGWDSGGSTPARGADFTDGAIEMALGTPLTAEVFYTYFVYKYPQSYVAMLSEIPKDPKDCIGRRFAFDAGRDPNEAVTNAFKKVAAKDFIV